MKAAAEVREHIWNKSRAIETGVVERRITSRGEKGAIIGWLNKTCGGSDNRHLLLGFLFYGDNNMSTYELTDAEWQVLYEWCGFFEEDNTWHVAQTFLDNVKTVMEAMRT